MPISAGRAIFWHISFRSTKSPRFTGLEHVFVRVSGEEARLLQDPESPAAGELRSRSVGREAVEAGHARIHRGEPGAEEGAHRAARVHHHFVDEGARLVQHARLQLLVAREESGVFRRAIEVIDLEPLEHEALELAARLVHPEQAAGVKGTPFGEESSPALAAS